MNRHEFLGQPCCSYAKAYSITVKMRENTLPKATVTDSAGFAAKVFIPIFAKGPIIRRPKVVGGAEKLKLEERAIEFFQKLRDKYGKGPLMVRVPGRKQSLILDPDHMRRVLDNTPEPFAIASSEKKAALSHFEPRQALISHHPERTDRRQFNEDILEFGKSVHHMAGDFISVIDEEAGLLVTDIPKNNNTLSWDNFIETWFRIVRRIIFGESARNAEEITDMAADLRRKANLAFLSSKDEELRDRFLNTIEAYVQKAEPGSLSEIMKQVQEKLNVEPKHQVPQWLFAFEPAAMTTFRALAVLSTHTRHLKEAENEIREDKTGGQHLKYLRSCVQETVRLWPTTPMVLRQTTEETEWHNGIMPAQTGILIYTPFFHRDSQTIPFANSFSPEIWINDETSEWPFIPFSWGPGTCAGKHLVLLVTSVLLKTLLEKVEFRLKNPGRLDPGKPLPGTLNNYSLTFEISPS